MATNTLYNIVKGELLTGNQTDIAGMANHAVTPTIVAHVEGTLIGDVTQQILLHKTQVALTVTGVSMYPSLGIAKGATLPVITLCQADLAAGSNTAIATVIDLTATALTAKTAVTGSVSAGSCAAGVGIYALFTKSSTGAVVGDTKLTFLVDYELTN